MRRLKHILILLVLLPLLGSAQFLAEGLQQEMDKVRDNYMALTRYEINVHYYIYTSHTATTASEESYGVYQKDNNKLRIKQHSVEMIQNDNYFLVKDDSAKVVVLAKADKQPKEGLDIAKLFKTFSRIELIKAKNKNQKGYRVYFGGGPSNEYEKAELYINKTTGLIDEAVVYYRKKFDMSTKPSKKEMQQPKMRMVYTKNDLSPKFLPSTFSVEKYVAVSTVGANTLKKQYSLYKFHDKTKTDGKH